ncbi:maleylpyruvate isomerase family mycothiol-dependent enzyme [Nocardia farcinica]|uniref:maleylpyruvate isomerase family mycothiol-dependent enzyme n=1 Tax=Nocardia farcinica TaxID=37329 RepID=UPI0024584866|nr:maleylpyruvate isomerase family mycothiol-dependent enzyme [Nocardia farcinica]
MTSDAHDLTPRTTLDQVAASTARLLETVRDLTDADLTAASPLPGWTRGHVVTHLARNADSLVNLLIWARTGVEIAQYPSTFLRDFDIDAGAPRPAEQQVLDLEAAVTRFTALADSAPPDAWGAVVRTRQGRPIAAAEIAWMRLLEVEIHHVDLGVDYTPDDWPNTFVARALPGVATDLAKAVSPDTEAFDLQATDTPFTATLGTGTPVHTVAGTSAHLLAWLLGRSTGESLSGPLPELPAWR